MIKIIDDLIIILFQVVLILTAISFGLLGFAILSAGFGRYKKDISK